MTVEYHDLAVDGARRSTSSTSATRCSRRSPTRRTTTRPRSSARKGVRLHLGVAVTEVGAGPRRRSPTARAIRTRCVVWGGGIKAPPLAAAAGLPRRAAAGASTSRADLTVDGLPGVYVVGDVANIPAPTAAAATRSSARSRCRAARWAAENILADVAGKPRKPFHYHDKGIMAMIGRGAAIAEVGPHRHELHGVIAFSAWLGVHAALMTGVRNRIDAFIAWGWDYFTSQRGPQVLDRSDAARSTGARTRAAAGRRTRELT